MDSSTINKALEGLKGRIIKRFGNLSEIFLFGSVARGDYDEESDIDVLILIPGEVDNSIREEVSFEAFEAGLKYDVVFGTIVYSLDFWNSEQAQVMPLYKNIEKESINI